jgi:acid phosphatase
MNVRPAPAGTRWRERKNSLKHRVLIQIFRAILTIASIVSADFPAFAQQTAQQAGTKPRQVFSQNVAAERIVNLDVLKNKIKQYHDCTCTCGCYARDLDAQADRAIAFLRRRAARKGATEKLALVLDIDETSLSNYAELQQSGFNYVKRDWNAWIDEAQAPVIPGTLRLYKEAQKLGVSVLFITGRSELQRAATERNLTTQGFTDWQKLILRPASAASQSTTAYKSSMRAQLVREGYKLVLNVGDQWSDLQGQPEAEFSVKYPDPFYLIP